MSAAELRDAIEDVRRIVFAFPVGDERRDRIRALADRLEKAASSLGWADAIARWTKQVETMTARLQQEQNQHRETLQRLADAEAKLRDIAEASDAWRNLNDPVQWSVNAPRVIREIGKLAKGEIE